MPLVIQFYNDATGFVVKSILAPAFPLVLTTKVNTKLFTYHLQSQAFKGSSCIKETTLCCFFNGEQSYGFTDMVMQFIAQLNHKIHKEHTAWKVGEHYNLLVIIESNVSYIKVNFIYLCMCGLR